MTASRFFIIEPDFCESDKDHEFDNLKLYPAKLKRISFLMKSRFILFYYCTG